MVLRSKAFRSTKQRSQISVVPITVYTLNPIVLEYILPKECSFLMSANTHARLVVFDTINRFNLFGLPD